MIAAPLQHFSSMEFVYISVTTHDRPLRWSSFE